MLFLLIIFGTGIHPFAVTAQSSELDISIRFYDQEIYTTDSNVRIRVSIRNNTSEEQIFRLADHRQFTVAFEVRTPENLIIPPSRDFVRVQTMNQPVFFREVTLEAGEEYSFVESLSQHTEIESSGVYVVQAILYPMLSTRSDQDEAGVRSNRLTLSIRPPTTRLEEAILSAEEEVRTQLLREDIPPDQTVQTMIEARQREQWERFFLYLDIESIMLRNPRLERQYLNSSASEREEMIEQYRETMQQEETADEILLIPQSFEILQTEYTPTDGSVVVEMRFTYPTYEEIREYTYYVRRQDGFWKIYDYTVRNLGTE